MENNNWLNIQILNENVHCYVENNNRAKKVLFVHGFNSSLNIWKAFIDTERDYDIAMLDLPGCGFTTACNQITIEYNQKIVAEFVRKIGYEDCLVVSHSMGACIALYLLENNLAKYGILSSPFNYKTNFFTSEWAKNFFKSTNSFLSLAKANKNSDKKNTLSLTKITKNLVKKTSALIGSSNKFAYLVSTQLMNKKYTSNKIKELYENVHNYMLITGSIDTCIQKDDVENVAKEQGVEIIVFDNINHGFWQQINSKQFQDIEKLIDEKLNQIQKISRQL
ncbi:alpha/beta fold hydrolase [Mycoplasma sp. 4044]